MSLIDSFDNHKKAIINANQAYLKHQRKLAACIITFSYEIIDNLKQNNLLELVDDKIIHSVNRTFSMYAYKNSNIGVILTSIGAPATVALIEEIAHVFSCKKFILFGSCGGLDKSIDPNKIIVPNAAYRDEGTSYHYQKASDYILIKNYQKVCDIFDELNIPYVVGKTWTTDAFYRETERNFQKRKQEGCIAVEMEISACQAMVDFRNYELYTFLYRGDNLDAKKWEKSFLANLAIYQKEKLNHFFLALEIAQKII